MWIRYTNLKNWIEKINTMMSKRSKMIYQSWKIILVLFLNKLLAPSPRSLKWRILGEQEFLIHGDVRDTLSWLVYKARWKLWPRQEGDPIGSVHPGESTSILFALSSPLPMPAPRHAETHIQWSRSQIRSALNSALFINWEKHVINWSLVVVLHTHTHHTHIYTHTHTHHSKLQRLENYMNT